MLHRLELVRRYPPLLPSRKQQEEDLQLREQPLLKVPLLRESRVSELMESVYLNRGWMRSEVVLNQMVRFYRSFFADREQANRNSNLQSLSVPPTIRTLCFRPPLPLLLRSTTVLLKHLVQFQLKLPVPLPLLRLPSLLSTFTPSSLEEDRRTLATLLLPLHLSRLNEDR